MSNMKLEQVAITSSGNRNDKKSKKIFAVAQQAGQHVEMTLANLRSQRQGLTQAEAAKRLALYGRNEVAHEKAPPALIQLLMAFNNPFIYVLLVLALVSFFTDYILPLRAGQETDLSGVIIICTMVMLSGLLRFWQEFRTNRAAQALQSLVRSQVTVLRREAGSETTQRQDVDMSELVPGDIILLSSGDQVPADVRLLSSRNLFISEAVLTGESLPVEKHSSDAGIDAEEQTAQELLASSNICLMGTSVASGTASVVVVATGGETWFGSLASSLTGSRPQTAFDRGVNSVSKLLIRFMLVMVPVVLLINGFTKGDWMDATLFALAVAVGLTPEMLPMIVSANLAKGAIAMSRRKVIVKKLNAIQNLGAMDVLCTDKTGTLTQDTILLAHHLDAQGSEDEQVLLLAWLNSGSQSGAKNLMDRAVLCAGDKVISQTQRSQYQLVDELPFDFTRRRVSVLVEDLTQHRSHLICKGAVEEMLAVSVAVRQGDAVVALDAAQRAALLAQTERYHQQGYRVLLVATRDGELHAPLSDSDERDLVIQGMLTFRDPPKASAGKAIKALRDSGVTVKVLTGDNPLVTLRVCADVGLTDPAMLTGDQIEAMNDDELALEAERCTLHPVCPADAAAEIASGAADAAERSHRRIPRRWYQ